MKSEIPAAAPISKSQRKRDMLGLRVLGQRLVALPEAKLINLPLTDELREAIAMARSLHARGAHKRQLQYIGKLMRGVDAESISSALDRMEQPDREAIQFHHTLEALREKLIAGDENTLRNFLDEHPYTDRQHLRSLIRQAQKEGQDSPRAARVLFRYLKEILANPDPD